MNYEVLAHYDSSSPNINELEMEKPYWPPENLPAPTLREKWELEPFLRGCLRGTFPIGLSKGCYQQKSTRKAYTTQSSQSFGSKKFAPIFFTDFFAESDNSMKTEPWKLLIIPFRKYKTSHGQPTFCEGPQWKNVFGLTELQKFLKSILPLKIWVCSPMSGESEISFVIENARGRLTVLASAPFNLSSYCLSPKILSAC